MVSSTTPNLDDRRFQDLVDEARRMIERFVPEWTNLEPSDPGMVLVELFAWMGEMAIFRLNQVPDVFYTRMLDLLGIQPYPPSAARTVVTFELAPGTAEEVVVAAGTQVATAGREPVVFATTAELVVRQPAVVAAVTVPADGAAVHVWNRLLAGDDSVALFGDPPTPGDSFLVGFAGSLAGALLELQLDLVPPPGIAADHPMPVWEAWVGEGWAPATVEHDATQRLMRSGDDADAAAERPRAAGRARARGRAGSGCGCSTPVPASRRCSTPRGSPPSRSRRWAAPSRRSTRRRCRARCSGSATGGPTNASAPARRRCWRGAMVRPCARSPTVPPSTGRRSPAS